MNKASMERLLPLLVLLLTLSASCTRESSHLRQPVVQVNASVMTAKEFGEELTRKLKSNDAVSAKNPSTIERMKNGILRDFIIQTLLLDWARENNLSPSEEDIENEISRIRSGYPDDLAVRRVLTQENISPQQWREQTRNYLIKEMVMKRLREDIPEPSLEEMRSFFDAHPDLFLQQERVQLRQIVVSKENDAERILEQLRDGASFEGLAREFSVAPERTEGGLTEWIERGVLEVFDRAFDMRIGQTSGVLESPFGFHIYQVVARQSAKKLSFEDSALKIKEALLLEREQLKYRAWLDQQIRSARVFKNEQLLEAIHVETSH